MRKNQPPTKGAKGDAKRGVDTSMIVRTKDFDKPVVQLKKGGYKMKPGLVYLGFSTDFLIEEADQWRGACWSMIKERSDCSFLFLTQKVWYKSPLNTDKGQCHQLKTGAFVLCEKTAKQMQLVGAGLCSARQDTPNYRKSSANPYALTRLAVEADAGHSRSRRRSVTDVGLPLAGTHRPGRMHRFYGNLRRICNFSMGRQSRRPLQQPFALSVGADDSVRPRDVPILRESSANSQLPPTSKEVTACGFAANSRRNSLHSAGRSRAPPLPTAVAFQRFLRKTNRLWS